MKSTLSPFFRVMFTPDDFFEEIRHLNKWKLPLTHLLLLAVWLSLGSVIAWSLGVDGGNPINSSLGAQMDVYPYWKDTLLPQMGIWSYPIAMGLIILEMLIITLIFTPLIYLVFRFLGGSPPSHGMLCAFQAFVYGLTPTAFGGFLPVAGLITGVFATLLQFQRGPSITLQNRKWGSYVIIVTFLAYAIYRYWNRELI
ncbi:MAG: YIP1 family protein [Chloroflexota bacterium]